MVLVQQSPPLSIFLIVSFLFPGYSELKGASDSSSCGGSKGMLVVTTLFGILTLSWLALRQSLSLTKMSSDYERMAMNYTHLANHIRYAYNLQKNFTGRCNKTDPKQQFSTWLGRDSGFITRQTMCLLNCKRIS